MNKNKSGIFSLIMWYLPMLVVQLISGSVTVTSLNPWYKDLVKASWTPPSWVFGPVWTILYIMMTISVWLIYRSDAPQGKRRVAYTLFFVQLVLNALWSFLFFGQHQTGLALIDLGLLVVVVSVMTIYFFRIRKSAGLLLAPYLIWIIYAFTLNAALFWLN